MLSGRVAFRFVSCERGPYAAHSYGASIFGESNSANFIILSCFNSECRRTKRRQRKKYTVSFEIAHWRRSYRGARVENVTLLIISNQTRVGFIAWQPLYFHGGQLFRTRRNRYLARDACTHYVKRFAPRCENRTQSIFTHLTRCVLFTFPPDRPECVSAPMKWRKRKQLGIFGHAAVGMFAFWM